MAGATIPTKIDSKTRKNDVLEAQQKTQRLHPSLLKLPTFRVGSWNLQGGLQDASKYALVIGDLADRRVSVACLQETHCSGSKVCDERGTVICLGDSPDVDVHRRYGLGFFYGKSLEPYYMDQTTAAFPTRSPSSDSETQKHPGIEIKHVHANPARFASSTCTHQRLK